jgi:hypothetical protein
MNDLFPLAAGLPDSILRFVRCCQWWLARRRLYFLAFLATGWLCFTPVLAAENVTDQAAIESARDALGGFGAFPWYDEERDAIQRLDVEPPSDVSSRKSKWEYQPINWSFPQWLTYLFEAFGWLMLAAVIVIVIIALLRAFGLAEFSVSATRGENAESPRGDIDRVEALPFQLQRPQSDLLAEARRHYEAGDYAQAMIYLYSYQLVQLDRHHLIRLTKGKTNRQYLREVRPKREIWDLLRNSMVAFEDVFFGHHPLDRERFDGCWNRLDQFHEQLEAVAV